MNCNVHTAEVACGACSYCGKFFCGDCLIEIDSRSYCRNDVEHAFAEAQKKGVSSQPMVFMNAGGGAAVSQQKKGVNHLLHFILTMLTGVWIFVWIFVVITHRN